MYDTFVKVEETRWTMRELMLTRSTFKNFPYTRYASDVTFQHSDQPTGNFNEAKKFYSRKHHLYGHKVEVSVLPKGIAINCIAWSPAATSDYNVFLDNVEFHHSAMQKLEGEADLNDEGPAQDRFENDWAILVEKGYQGLQRGFRTIQPKKKARGAPPLSADENRENDRISHDRVIVENFFGRLKSLWGVYSHKWAWDRNTYNMNFRVCLAATNFHVGCNPLRREDGEYYRRHESRLIKIGTYIEEAKKRKREQYRDNRRARLEITPRRTRRRQSGDTLRENNSRNQAAKVVTHPKPRMLFASKKP
ncbi:hypothetical protein PHMEG_00027327 [Phytophthora megakarya]|uniref:DDE Tnp4 domain-containing protein n=1 Tax=Phytophthora megakarya TaxID=4795 RepID=A0A225V7H1_9STRA|nr:hypothetical protein PHMEG_00027327 [Phytophthora megakarya]